MFRVAIDQTQTGFRVTRLASDGAVICSTNRYTLAGGMEVVTDWKDDEDEGLSVHSDIVRAHESGGPVAPMDIVFPTE